MNPIVRMMKRYMKMPLKYALPLLFIGALVLASTTGCVDNTATPTPTVKATATVAATVKATATPSSGPQLSASQLDTLQSGMEAKGYTFTEPLEQSGGIGSSYVGSTFYKGKMLKDGITYRMTVEVCKNKATADSQFAFSVSNLKQMGFAGSYDTPTVWSGTTMMNGVAMGANAVESAEGSPYMVTTMFVSEE